MNYNKLQKLLTFKINHPEVRMPEICKSVNLSESSVNRMRRDLDMKPINQYTIPVNEIEEI